MDNNQAPETLIIKVKRNWKPAVKKILLWTGVIGGTALVTYLLTHQEDLNDESYPLDAGDTSLDAEIEA